MRNKLLKMGIFSNDRINVNSQQMIRRRPELLNELHDFTSWLPSNCSLKERIFVVYSKLDSVPKCGVCGDNASFDIRGASEYSKTCCDKKCASLLRLKTLGAAGITNISEKRYKTLARLDKDGLSGFDRMYKKQHATKVSKNLVLPYDKMSELTKYRNKCNSISSKFDLSKLPNYEFRGVNGTQNAYQIDHEISIVYGFKNGISPEIIGHICNLKMIPWKDNVRKNIKCSITLEVLLEKISKYK